MVCQIKDIKINQKFTVTGKQQLTKLSNEPTYTLVPNRRAFWKFHGIFRVTLEQSFQNFIKIVWELTEQSAKNLRYESIAAN